MAARNGSPVGATPFKHIFDIVRSDFPQGAETQWTTLLEYEWDTMASLPGLGRLAVAYPVPTRWANEFQPSGLCKISAQT